MNNNISIQQISKSLRISEESVSELLHRSGITAVDGDISINQATYLMERVESDDSLCEIRSRENLVRVVRRFTLIADTCTLLNENFPLLYRHLTPMLLTNGKRLVVPTCVVTELKRHLLNKPELRQRAADVLKLLEEGERDRLVEFLGDETDTFGDQQILSLATKLYVRGDVLLITYDHDLSRDALNLNELHSVQGWEVAVSRLNTHGYLSRYNPIQRDSGEKSEAGASISITESHAA